MSNQVVANRYAVALFQLAKEKGTLEQVNNELKVVKEVLEQTKGFKSFLVHPKVEPSKKAELIKSSFSNAVGQLVLNMLLLLVERKRTDIITAMITKFETLSYEELNVALAKVYSTKPLSTEQEEQLSKSFAKKVSKSKLYIENIVDPSLIGGIKIRIGDRIYDGSVKGQLDKLSRQLISKS